MKKLILAIFLLPLLAHSQMTFTGGPLNTSGQCWTLWADEDSAFMGFNDGLYRTLDGGDSWTHLTNGILADVDPRTIEYSNGTLFVGTNDGSRIYQSTDFGDSFTGGTGSIVSFAIPTASTAGDNFSMMGGTTFDPNYFDFNTNDWISTGNGGISHGMRHLGGDTVWVCSGSVSSGTTSYSHDNGISWTSIMNEPQTDVGGGVVLSSVAQDFLKVGNRILVGTNLVGFPVLYTDDYGNTWQASDLASTTWSDYGKRFIRVNDNHLLTVNLSGIWKSVDQGATWSLIQGLSKIRTMVLFNGNHLLVGTDEGVFEFDDYGEGELLKKHGVSGSASNLIVHSNGNILAGTSQGVQQYNVSTGIWSVLQDTLESGIPFAASMSITQVGDALHAMDRSNYYTSVDNGITFNLESTEQFGSNPPTAVAELSGKKFVSSYENFGAPQPPEIFYSNDNGANYVQATFTNAVSYGYGGAGSNFVERFLETPTALIADMNAGYAISIDEGVSWTFYGGVWDISFLTTAGASIYHYRATAVPFPERVIEVSEDNGSSWTEVTTNGLPNEGGSNYLGYWGIWNLNGDICTYNSYEDPRGIYKLNSSSSLWELIPNTASSIENWDGVTSMHYIEGAYYANWHLNGTWKVGSGPVGVNDLSSDNNGIVFPNPVVDILNFQVEDKVSSISILNSTGHLVKKMNVGNDQNTVDLVGLSPGYYLIRLTGSASTTMTKILKL